MKEPKTSLPATSRPERLELFQLYELEMDMEIAKANGKTMKYHLNRLTDNGRWVFVVLSDNTEAPYTKKQMSGYRAAEEWVDKGGKCPFALTPEMESAIMAKS